MNRAWRLLLICSIGAVLIAAAAYRRARIAAPDPPVPLPLTQRDVFRATPENAEKGIPAMNENEPIARLSFEAAALFKEHPPRLYNRNKEVVYAKACPPGCTHSGTLEFTRWREMKLPEKIPVAAPKIEPRIDIYRYEKNVPGYTEWYVNFADEHLFAYYGGALLAQDELQVAEHPGLGALREALLKKDLEFGTYQDGRPTPVLVKGVQRRCALSLDADSSQGRPRGLYGNNFGAAPVVAIERAIRVIDPPTVSNIIAIAAPSGGNGDYKWEEIELILATAYTGFRAAKLESHGPLIIHTGFWGCGAFGGNRELMAAIQLFAARLAGVDSVIFHTFNGDGMEQCERARVLMDDILKKNPSWTVRDVVLELSNLDFKWGTSDGN